MTWLLTFFMLLPDGTTVITEVGLMNGIDLCQTTGAAIELRMRIETPEIVAGWTCTDTGAMS